MLQTGALRILSYSPNVDLPSGPGRSRTDHLRIAGAVLSRTELQAQGPAAMAGQRVFNYARTGVNSSERPMRTASMRTSLHLPAREKKGARIGAQQIESNESSPYLRSSIAANNVGASVPPLRAGLLSREMEARVDCGNADPPCVSSLLCRCSRAEHRVGARWWKKESNLLVPRGCRPRRSHLIDVRLWSDYSRHPSRSRASARTVEHQRTASRSANVGRSIDTTIRRRDAWLRLAGHDSYAIG